MDESTVALVERVLNYSAERLCQLEALLTRDSKEKEIVMGLRSLTSVMVHLLEKEEHE